MAAVFLAQDLVLERQVAIKVLPPDTTRDAELTARFQQEAKTAAKLDHPNIIPIYRVESEAGLVYIVMKYVSGQSLEELLDRGPLSIAHGRHVLREAALALGHAHRRRIVHRDVKPANIMLDEDGRVVLTDFGISKAVQGTTHLTGTGTIIGTPQYMAPEQAKGREVDGRADQYALGMVGYRALTGELPFEGDPQEHPLPAGPRAAALGARAASRHPARPARRPGPGAGQGFEVAFHRRSGGVCCFRSAESVPAPPSSAPPRR